MWTSRHRTWDEYLDIRFLFTRVLVTCFGALFIVGFAVASCVWLASVWPKAPPEPSPRSEGPEEDIEVRTCSFEPEKPPLVEYFFPPVLAALPVYGMVLVWRRPRGGFLMAGAGLALIMAVFRVRVLLERGLEELGETFGWTHDTVVLGLLLWFAFAWWKVGPPRPAEPFREALR